MSVEMTGADLLAFMADKSFWSEGRWYEDATLSINGGEFFDWDGEPIAPTDKIVWDGGVVYDGADVGANSDDLERAIKKWLKAQLVERVVVEVVKEHREAFDAMIAGATGQVAGKEASIARVLR